MKPGASPRLRWTFALAAINLALMAMLAGELRPAKSRDPTLPPVVAQGGGTDAALSAGAAARTESFTPPPLADFREVAERPLFSPLRRPPVTAEPAATETQRPEPPFTLVGVIISGSNRLAVFRRKDATSPQTAWQGDLIDGWRVEAVASDRAVVSQRGVRHVLELDHREPQVTAAPPAPDTRAAPDPGPPGGDRPPPAPVLKGLIGRGPAAHAPATQ